MSIHDGMIDNNNKGNDKHRSLVLADQKVLFSLTKYMHVIPLWATLILFHFCLCSVCVLWSVPSCIWSSWWCGRWFCWQTLCSSSGLSTSGHSGSLSGVCTTRFDTRGWWVSFSGASEPSISLLKGGETCIFRTMDSSSWLHSVAFIALIALNKCRTLAVACRLVIVLKIPNLTV